MRLRTPCLLGALALALAGASLAAPVPTPIGVGPRFHPLASTQLVRAGARVGPFRCAGALPRHGVHLELFARGRVVIVPPGIGVAAPFVHDGAYVRPRGCTYPVRTLEPTGVLEVQRGRALVLGDLFRIWGQPLSTTRLAGFRTTAARPVRAYVAGRRWPGDPRTIPLTRHAQIVLQLGAYVPPHRSFAFRKGL